MPRLTDLLASTPIDLNVVTEHLNALDTEQRLEEVRQVPAVRDEGQRLGTRGGVVNAVDRRLS